MKRLINRRGQSQRNPGIYIVLGENENRESFFLLDEEEQDRTIFLVRSFGFNHQRLRRFYRKLRWNVPGKNPDHWNEEPGGMEPSEKPNIEVCIVAGMIACYVIPKLLEVMKLH